MKYVAKEDFIDLMDGNHMYRAGEEYPRPGCSVSDERVAELAGADNKVGRPLIEAVEQPYEPLKEEPKEEPKETHDEAVEAPRKARRGRAKGDEDD